MVVETSIPAIPVSTFTTPFNPPLAGMVVETLNLASVNVPSTSFNPPLAGMVVET